ncbi:metallophosphoesterase [Clostridium perfringens]
MRKLIKPLSVATMMFLSLNLCFFNGKIVKGEEISNETKVTILGTSDIHGRFVPWEYSSDTENKSGSLSQISTIVKKERNENPNLILVDAGDSIQDNFVETFNKGPHQPMILGMNKMKYDVWEMGNHEFNFGLDVLKHVTSQFEGKVLAGNIYNDDGTRFMDGYTIIERDGIKIGIIGMDTPMIKEFEKPYNIKGIEFRDPVKETKKIIKELDGKVDAMIGVMHMGLDNENAISNTGVTDIANQCPELTAIVGGHMHKLVKNEAVNGVIITEPGKYGQAVSKIDLTFKKENGKNVLKNKNADTISVANVESDKEIEDLLKPFHEELRKDANSVIGRLEGVNMVDEDYIKEIPTIHIEDTPLIDFFHEVGKYYSKADVIALSIDNDKAKLNVGDIKKKDIAYNYRYTGGEISVYEVTGKDLKKYFEGKEFKKLWDSKTAYGEEEGTIRNLAIDYIKNVKNGLINAKKQNNWCLLGIDPNSENYKKVRDLVNSGELKIPTSEDGKYTNIASINEKDLPSDNNTSKENEENINLDSINNKNNNKDQGVNEESKKDVPKVDENIEKQKNNKENNSNEDNTLVKEDSKSKEVNEKNNEQNNIEEVSKKENKLPNTGSPIGAEAMSQIGMLLLGAGVILKKKNKK